MTSCKLIADLSKKFIFDHGAEIGHAMARQGIMAEQIPSAKALVDFGFRLCILALLEGHIHESKLIEIAEHISVEGGEEILKIVTNRN